jgi:D-alanyl-D-alanine carboxypeptidase
MRLILLAFPALALAAAAMLLFPPGNSTPSAPSLDAVHLDAQGCADNCPDTPEARGPAVASSTGPCPACGQNEELWRTSTDQPPPALLGKAAALVEASCGKMIYGTGSRERLPPASLNKITTALAVQEFGRSREVVDITINGWELSIRDDSTIMGLEAGMRLTVEELLQGLLLMSGNDAAIALAQHFGGEERLVRRMNDMATRLGLTDTQFRNVHGLDADGQYASAFDLTVLGRTLLADPFLQTLVSSDKVRALWTDREIWNGNWLMYIYPGARGIKTGYTEAAGGTIVAAAERDGRTLVASVLNSADVFYDSIRLFNWAFARVPRVC